MTQVCFDKTTFYTSMIVSLGILVYALLKPPTEITKTKTLTQTKYVLVPPPIQDPTTSQRDYETYRFIHPMMPPLRRGPFNLSSRSRYRYGDTVSFNQMGFLHNPENLDQIMPLMGRRLHSQKYEYYTFHHSNPDIKIPIKISGDKEILDSDNITIEPYSKTFKATIYDLDTPKYVPF
jgi:hypothetical protein